MTREKWHYRGRGEVQGQDCYRWVRYLDVPDPETGYTKMGYIHPVASFWP